VSSKNNKRDKEEESEEQLVQVDNKTKTTIISRDEFLADKAVTHDYIVVLLGKQTTHKLC
jgi:hypothetical protein